jgi:hypothetical protein
MEYVFVCPAGSGYAVALNPSKFLTMVAARAAALVVDEFDCGVMGVVVPALGGAAGFVLVLPGDVAAEDAGALIFKAVYQL